MNQHRRIVPNKHYHLFDEPNVFMVKGLKGINKLFPKLKRGDWCFESLMWFLTWRSALSYLNRWRQMKSKGINYVVMANSAIEVQRCKVFGIPVCLMPQGQFINENHLPVATRNRDCIYDAFYAAQAKPFKRLYLAKDIQNLYVLTYSCPTNLNGVNDLSLFEPRIKHATWNSSYIHDVNLVVDLLHSSRCALALSKIEGAMWAALEANLCGLPVISTKSLGGRDRYFNAANSKIVAASSKAVADAVNFYHLHPPDPSVVREATLQLIQLDRQQTAKYFASEVLQSSQWSISSVETHLFKAEGGISRFLVST
jgi:glycosyltransferase involved in cell wall biosynthesis